MSLSKLYSSQKPSVISQLSRIRAEADHMKKMGVPESQIAQHLQGRYTDTDIPAEALYAMLKDLQPPTPKPNGDTLAVQAAKLVLQKAQQEQQPDINVQQLQSALQPPPPPQQQGAPQQGDPQYGQGSMPMQQGAQPGPAVQPMRKGGLADLPKPNVGSEKNFAKGGIVAFSEGGVSFKDSVIGRGLQNTGDLLYNTIPSYMYDAGAALWNAGSHLGGGSFLPYVDPFDPADKDRLDSWDNLLHPKEATKPTVLADAEKGSPGSTWGGPPGRRRLPSAPQAAEPESNPPAAPVGLAALETEPSNVRDAFIKRAQQAAPTLQDIINQAKQASSAFDVESGATSAQNRYGELAKKLEQARDQAVKDSRDIARYEGARIGGEQGPIMGFLANRAAAAKARADANKDYLAGITGLTKAQVDLDVNRTERSMKLRDLSLAMQQRGNEQAADLFAKAADLYQRGEETAARLAQEAAYRQASIQETARGHDLTAQGRRDAILKDDKYDNMRKRYLKMKADPKADPEKLQALRIIMSSPPWGIDPELLVAPALRGLAQKKSVKGSA
jgi:hypothetical protein